jgi:hypothetical protein
MSVIWLIRDLYLVKILPQPETTASFSPSQHSVETFEIPRRDIVEMVFLKDMYMLNIRTVPLMIWEA